jgi:hypothetical protein
VNPYTGALTVARRRRPSSWCVDQGCGTPVSRTNAEPAGANGWMGNLTAGHLRFAKCSLPGNAAVSLPVLQRVSVTPPLIHIAWSSGPQRFDLSYYDSTDLVVPGWLLGLTDSEGHLQQTEFLAGAGRPEAVFRWLASKVGPDVALHLVRQAQEVLVKESANAVGV